jgi:hypothetical protein
MGSTIFSHLMIQRVERPELLTGLKTICFNFFELFLQELSRMFDSAKIQKGRRTSDISFESCVLVKIQVQVPEGFCNDNYLSNLLYVTCYYGLQRHPAGMDANRIVFDESFYRDYS